MHNLCVDMRLNLKPGTCSTLSSLMPLSRRTVPICSTLAVLPSAIVMVLGYTTNGEYDSNGSRLEHI